MSRTPAHPPPPRDEAQLLERAERLAAATLGELAERYRVPVPPSPHQAKGFAGQLLELALGATAASAPAPDFEHLGIELKSIPVGTHGRPRESTHVCVAPIRYPTGLRWETSLVRRKLSRVLWVPVLTPGHTPVADRQVGHAFLWSPTRAQETVLQGDWEELVELIALGRLSEISARLGTYLQLRPKARDGKLRGWTTDATGLPIPANPRGFYLRARFTHSLLNDALSLPAHAQQSF